MSDPKMRVVRVLLDGEDYSVDDTIKVSPIESKTIKDIGVNASPGLLSLVFVFTDGSVRQIFGRPFTVDLEEAKIVRVGRE
jgi:hypothetical protein